jgi:hypothetical protein
MAEIHHCLQSFATAAQPKVTTDTKSQINPFHAQHDKAGHPSQKRSNRHTANNRLVTIEAKCSP